MKVLKLMPLVPACILSSITNILFIVNIAPYWMFEIGFILVLISSVVASIMHNGIEKKAACDKLANKSAVIKNWYVYPLIFILAFWFISYGIALFIK